MKPAAMLSYTMWLTFQRLSWSASAKLTSGFSLLYNGKFITTDLSPCMDSRFNKVAGEKLKK